MYKNKYAVYRKSDGAIAVLSNAEFQGTTPAMLDGSKYGALLNNVEVMLMYAVAKVDYCDTGGFRLKQNDAILILAHCKGTFIGINTRKKVGLFSSDLVQPITKGRLCIFKGMILKMTVVVDCYSKKLYEGLTYDITKSPEGLFSWFTEDGQRVPLHALAEAEHVRVRHSYENESYFGEGLTQLQNNKRKLPQLPNNDRSSDENISSLYEETWFHGNLPRTEAEKILKNNGDFLVRNMSSHPGIYVLSCKTVNGCEHFKLTLDQTSHYKTCGGQFKSIGNLIQFHQSNLAPISRDPATIIWRPVKSTDYVKEMADKHYQEIMSNTEAEDPFLGMSSPTEKSRGSLENAEFCPSVVISNPKPIYENDAIKELSLNDEQKTMADDGGKNIVQESETEPDMVIPPQNTSLDNFKQYEHGLYEVVPDEESSIFMCTKDLHVYEEPDEGKSPAKGEELLVPPEERKQRTRSRSPFGNKESKVFSQLCRMERHISDLKNHFQSITLSQGSDEEASL